MSSASAFNAEEIQACIAREWIDVADKLGDRAAPNSDKPTVYKSKAGTTARKTNGKGSTMANQNDFLEELRRQLAN